VKLRLVSTKEHSLHTVNMHRMTACILYVCEEWQNRAPEPKFQKCQYCMCLQPYELIEHSIHKQANKKTVTASQS